MIWHLIHMQLLYIYMYTCIPYLELATLQGWFHYLLYSWYCHRFCRDKEQWCTRLDPGQVINVGNVFWARLALLLPLELETRPLPPEIWPLSRVWTWEVEEEGEYHSSKTPALVWGEGLEGWSPWKPWVCPCGVWAEAVVPCVSLLGYLQADR